MIESEDEREGARKEWLSNDYTRHVLKKAVEQEKGLLMLLVRKAKESRDPDVLRAYAKLAAQQALISMLSKGDTRANAS